MKVAKTLVKQENFLHGPLQMCQALLSLRQYTLFEALMSGAGQSLFQISFRPDGKFSISNAVQTVQEESETNFHTT